jgi:hypothetical protein
LYPVFPPSLAALIQSSQCSCCILPLV